MTASQEPGPLAYIPAQYVRPSKLSEVRAPAILLPLDKYDEPFVVTGVGEAAMVCFLGNQHTFHAFEQSKAEHYKGLAVEDVGFEVDVTSTYSLDGVYAVAGSVVRTGSKLELVALTQRGQYPGTARVILTDDLPVTGEREAVGFRRWRAVLTVDTERYLVWSVEAATNQER